MEGKKKVGVIGAGASGLTAIKSAVEDGISYYPRYINPYYLAAKLSNKKFSCL